MLDQLIAEHAERIESGDDEVEDEPAEAKASDADVLPPEADDNLWSINRTEARSSGLKQLPQDLRQALDLMEDSDLVATALGEHIFEWFLRNKRSEWELYQGKVTPFEIEHYLPVW